MMERLRAADVVRSAVQTVWKSNPEVLEPIGDFCGTDGARMKDDSIWKSPGM